MALSQHSIECSKFMSGRGLRGKIGDWDDVLVVA